MREIKFRGQRAKTGKLVVGNYIKMMESDETTVTRATYSHHIHDTEGLHRIDLRSLGQYTGLKDKNGKEIYEGDILKVIDGEQIGWLGDGDPKMRDLIAKVKWEGGLFFCEHIGLVEPHDWDIEVIGNVYEHPELLNQPIQ